MSNYYVYELAYPVSMGGQVFYVGKGTNAGVIDRIDVHEIEARNDTGSNPNKHAIIRSIWEAGEQVVKRKIAHFNDEEQAYMYEWALIHMTTYAPLLVNRKLGRDRAKSRITHYANPVSHAPFVPWKPPVHIPIPRYKVFRTGVDEYQIFWCPSAPYHYNDKTPHSEKVYSVNPYYLCRKLNKRLFEEMSESVKTGT